MEDSEKFIKNQYGYCYYCICKDCSMIYNLYIEKEYRRKGHARNLIQSAIDTIRANGYEKDIKVEANPSEDSISIEKLVSFYKEMGLKVIDKVSKTE